MAAAGTEDEHWEAKSEIAKTGQLTKAVAGFANSDGGLLIIGAAQGADHSWELPGAPYPSEPGLKVSQDIHRGLSPVPPHTLHVLPTQPGRAVILVRVRPHPTDLVASGEGLTYQRLHGRTERIKDSAEVTRLARLRSGAGPVTVDPTASPQALESSAAALLQSDRATELRC